MYVSNKSPTKCETEAYLRRSTKKHKAIVWKRKGEETEYDRNAWKDTEWRQYQNCLHNKPLFLFIQFVWHNNYTTTYRKGNIFWKHPSFYEHWLFQKKPNIPKAMTTGTNGGHGYIFQRFCFLRRFNSHLSLIFLHTQTLLPHLLDKIPAFIV